MPRHENVSLPHFSQLIRLTASSCPCQQQTILINYFTNTPNTYKKSHLPTFHKHNSIIHLWTHGYTTLAPKAEKVLCPPKGSEYLSSHSEPNRFTQTTREADPACPDEIKRQGRIIYHLSPYPSSTSIHLLSSFTSHHSPNFLPTSLLLLLPPSLLPSSPLSTRPLHQHTTSTTRSNPTHIIPNIYSRTQQSIFPVSRNIFLQSHTLLLPQSPQRIFPYHADRGPTHNPPAPGHSRIRNRVGYHDSNRAPLGAAAWETACQHSL